MQALPKSMKLCPSQRSPQLPQPATAEGRSNNFLLGKVSCGSPSPASRIHASFYPLLLLLPAAAVRSQSCRCAFGEATPPQTLTARSSHATPCPASLAWQVANCCNSRRRVKDKWRRRTFVICLPPASLLGLEPLDHASFCTGNFHFHPPPTVSPLHRCLVG